MYYYISLNSFNCKVSIGAVVELDEDQARRRKHSVSHVSGNVYEVTYPIHFKNGERFGVEEKLDHKLNHKLYEEEVKEKAKEEVEVKKTVKKKTKKKTKGK